MSKINVNIRQLSFFCITDLNCTKKNFYTYTENQTNKRVNKVASTLEDFLNRIGIQIFGDKYVGQNKNCYVIHAMCLQLYNNATINLNNVRVILPVRGQLFMPVEKRNTKQTKIILKEDYEEPLERRGHLKKLGIEWKLRDFKTMSDTYY